MSEIVITTISHGEAYSGHEKLEPKSSIVTFKNNFGGVIPNTVFCPACSTLTEYNAKWGEIQEKKNPTERDYCFDVGYATEGLEKW